MLDSTASRYLPNLLRNSVISATELVVYDSSKEALLNAGMQEGVAMHFTSGASCLGCTWVCVILWQCK